MSNVRTDLRAYRPGAWYAVLGEDMAVLLPASERGRVAALWDLVDSGGSSEEVLDSVVAAGLRSLPGLVLLAREGQLVRVVVRGPARVLLDTGEGPVTVEHRPGTSWAERVVEHVRSARVLVEDDRGEDGPGQSGGADHLVTNGLVRVSRLDWPPRAGEAGGRRPPVGEPEPEPHPEPEPEPEPEPRRAEPPPTELFDVAAAAELDPDHDGTTQQGTWTGPELGRTPPGIPGQPPAPDVTGRPVATLLFSHGEEVAVDRVVLVGRAPEARRSAASDQPRLVTVPSPHQEISSTHLEVRPGSGADHGSAVVTDLGSTNGTVLVQPGLDAETLQPGVPVQLLPGALIDVGDGSTISVARA